jgi:hypothetical protein
MIHQYFQTTPFTGNVRKYQWINSKSIIYNPNFLAIAAGIAFLLTMIQVVLYLT